jgi:hypothetical protein
MSISIVIRLAGAAITEDRDGEVARILHRLADRIAQDGLDAVDCTRLFDINGNGLGEIYLSDETQMTTKQKEIHR